MEYFQNGAVSEDKDLTFPLLVDATNDSAVVLKESYEILQHLWQTYGETIVPSRINGNRRPDQRVNDSQIPFIFRFLSLAGPSYLRPFPTCGLLQTPSNYNNKSSLPIVLHQAEGCPESRLVREILCTLEIPYHSVSSTSAENNHPMLEIASDTTLHGAKACTDYLWESFHDTTKALPTLINPVPRSNLGRSGSFPIGAYIAFVKGSRALVPPDAMK
mmetsp:Transcript_18041/g.27276  ORF Transcript_18041/g.27276 Transcript_18041/m.27276 type:complete len:217 (-) Transcript_18041:338-988(-)